MLRRCPGFIEGGGDLKRPADPTYTSCRLTVAGQRLALTFLPDFRRKPEFPNWPDRRTVSAGLIHGNPSPLASDSRCFAEETAMTPHKTVTIHWIGGLLDGKTVSILLDENYERQFGAFGGLATQAVIGTQFISAMQKNDDELHVSPVVYEVIDRQENDKEISLAVELIRPPEPKA